MTQHADNLPKIAYFNAHTEGLGYLDSLVEVKPKAGQDFKAFWTAIFCMLEGDPKNPEKVYVSLKVPGADVIEVLSPYLSDINSPATKVFVGLRLAKFRAEPYKHGPSSKTPGELGINYFARLIKVIYLKVGDSVIKLNSNNDQPGNILGFPKVSNADKANPVISGLFHKPVFVTLSKSDAQFSSEKDRLKASGYAWHSERQAWMLREVVVAVGDHEMTEKALFLESNGYSFSNENSVWRMAFPKSKTNNGYSKTSHQIASNH